MNEDQPAERPAARRSDSAHAHDDASVVAFREPLVRRADAILASISDGIVAVDNDWRLSMSIAAAERMWGRELAALIGTPIHDRARYRPRQSVSRRLYGVEANGEPMAFAAIRRCSPHGWKCAAIRMREGYTMLFRAATEDGCRSSAAPSKASASARSTRSINQRIFDTSLDLIWWSTGAAISFASAQVRSPFSATAPRRWSAAARRTSCSGRSGKHARQHAARAPRRHQAQFRMPLRAQAMAIRCRSRWTGIWSEPDAAVFLHRPRHDRADHAGEPAAPGAEDGGDRPAHRRRRARLQQHPDRHHRDDRASVRRARGRPEARADRRGDRRGGHARRAAHAAHAGLCPQAAAAGAR